LDFSLNHKDGGELSVNLHRLYDYMNGRLHQSNRETKREEGILEVIRQLSVLRDAWCQMLQGRTCQRFPKWQRS